MRTCRAFATSPSWPTTPPRLAHWYGELFGTNVLGRSAAGDVSISDGFCNLTFFKRRPADDGWGEAGLHHMGLIDFYSRVFGPRELPTSFKRRQANLGNRFGGDGFTNLALHPYPPEPGREGGRHQRVGLNHFGFLVPDCDTVLSALDLNPKDSERPANRPYAEYRVFDPEGNAVDISQFKGWEVDTNRWERVTEPV